MRRKSTFGLASLAVVASGAAFSAGSGSRPTHVTLDRDAEPLKAIFNRDVGRVRLLLLVAPT